VCADRLTTRLVPARSPRAGGVVGLLGAVIVAGALAGCTPVPAPSPTPTVSISLTPTVTTSAAPQQVSEATTADEALPFFVDVVAAVWATDQRFQGRAYIDGLTQAGFDKSAMEVTYDESTVGNPSESIQFSVRWGEECLAGQVGPSTGDPVTVVMPGLQTGRCLVGETRPIDW
jgi:hypothetical protein